MNLFLFYYFTTTTSAQWSWSWSSVPWSGVVTGSRRRLAPDQSLPHIWVESRRDSYSHVAFLEKVDPVELIPLQVKLQPIWRLALVTENVVIDSIGESLALRADYSLRSRPSSDIATAYIAMEPSLPLVARWRIYEDSFALWELLFLFLLDFKPLSSL